ncbi:MAG: hypothetical protein NXH85_09610 [Pseudomonadaceae bacterium]|nr:hypothetical protein [Pseudomonadaceae bacterium]
MTIPTTTENRAPLILAIHGSGHKPTEAEYQQLWHDALRAGVAREGVDELGVFERAEFQLVYFGDLLSVLHTPVDPQIDLADRRRVVSELAELDKAKRFRRATYEKLPGKSPFREFVADVSAPLLRAFGMGRAATGAVVPELREYWQSGSEFARQVDDRLERALGDALSQERHVILISHGFGCIPAYNALWRIDQAQPRFSGRIDTWLTLGSPLSDDTIRSSLAGASSPIDKRYPNNILRWHNVAAEDDYFCHDETIANDFSDMLARRMVSELADYRIYNVACRYGKSEPHHSAGYLAHPRVARLLVESLSGSA